MRCRLRSPGSGLKPCAGRAVQVWAAYSPVKNSPADARAKGAGGDPSHSAASGELDLYKANCQAGISSGLPSFSSDPQTCPLVLLEGEGSAPWAAKAQRRLGPAACSVLPSLLSGG